jgi:hypothetical protein
MMNKLDHRPQKYTTLKHLIRYFLLSQCKKPHKHQDYTTELNPLFYIDLENDDD